LKDLIKTFEIDMNDQSAKNEIANKVSSIETNFSTNGKYQMTKVNWQIKSLIESFIPSHLKYLIMSCVNRNGFFENTRGRNLAKAYKSVHHRGKIEEMIEKCVNPEKHIWKEVVEDLSLDKN